MNIYELLNVYINGLQICTSTVFKVLSLITLLIMFAYNIILLIFSVITIIL